MPVRSMHESGWDDSRDMVANGQELPAMRQNVGLSGPPPNAGPRTQDDARVGYLFQRSQGGDTVPPFGKQRWMVDSERNAMEQVCYCFSGSPTGQ